MSFGASIAYPVIDDGSPVAELLASLTDELDSIDLSQQRHISVVARRTILRSSGIDIKQSPLVTKLIVLATRGIITPEECAQLTEFATTR